MPSTLGFLAYFLVLLGVCADEIASKGKYTNSSYGFSLRIPEHLEGYWNSVRCVNSTEGCTCMSDHGRIIPLTSKPWEPERHIEVFASHSTPEEAAVRRGEMLSRSATTVSGQPAERVVFRYYDEKLNRWSIEDRIEIPRKGVEYSLYLRTKEMSYSDDRVIFEKIVASFRFRR